MLYAGVWLLEVIEADMRRMYRRSVRGVWLLRGLVFWNLACTAFQLARADAAPWLLVLTPVSLYCAWSAFKTGERGAATLPHLRGYLGDVREKIKTAKRLANENRS